MRELLPEKDDNNFSRIIATTARGSLQSNRKVYAPFRESSWADSVQNPSINNAHITSDYDYHEQETTKHWGKSKGHKSVFQLGTSSSGSKFHTIDSELGSDHIQKPYHREEHNGTSVKMFGRTRVIQPFARTKSYAAEHSADLLSRHMHREEYKKTHGPNPKTYHPYSDSWQKKAVCGVVVESSTFLSQSPLRLLFRESYKNDKENLKLVSRRIPPKSAPAAIPVNSNIRQSFLDDSNSVLSPSTIPEQKSVEIKVQGNQQLRKKGKEKKNLNKNESLRIFDSYFDMNDSDGESTGTFQSRLDRRLLKKNQAIHKSLPSRNGSFGVDAFHNLRDQGNSDPLMSRQQSNNSMLSMDDELPIGIQSHFPMEKSQESLMINTDINDADYIKRSQSQSPMIQRVHQNRDYLLELRSKLNSPGTSMGKSTRRDTWMGGSPEARGARDENYVNRRVKFPDGTPVIVMGSPDEFALPHGTVIESSSSRSISPPIALNADPLMASKSFSSPNLQSHSASAFLGRPQSAPKLFEWQPKMYQSKSILQRKYEDRKQIGIINSNMADKKNSNIIHSSIAECIPLGSLASPSNDSRNRNARKIEMNTDQKVISSAESRRAESMMQFARSGSLRSLKTNSEDTYKDRVLFLPKRKGDTLGTHLKKKNKDKLSKDNNPIIVESPPDRQLSYDFLSKIAHLTDDYDEEL